jgi:arginase
VIAIVAAPSNLGLRPPQPGSVPGTAKAPEALREAGLYERLRAAGARDAGVVLPGRYADDGDPSAKRIRNQDAIADHARRLALRLTEVLDAGDAPLVLGGDCSLVVGAGLALRRRGTFGLAHLDGHTDFRHPGNDPNCASLAGEDLAAAIGLHWPGVADVDHLGPYFDPTHVAHVGCRDDDEALIEVRQRIAAVLPASEVGDTGVAEVRAALARADDGYWLHIDVDILDPAYLPAVDSPAPGGLRPAELIALLSELAPRAVGAQVTVFDPDLDPDGRYALLLADLIASGLSHLGAAPRPLPTTAD